MILPPNKRSAPLPVRHPMRPPTPADIEAELDRAAVELMYALNRHRTAWSKMAALKELARKSGNDWFMDNSRQWKVATGDVTWWRGEVSCQSNAIQALLAYQDHRRSTRGEPGEPQVT